MQTPPYSDRLLLRWPWVEVTDSGYWEMGTDTAGMGGIRLPLEGAASETSAKWP